MVTAHCGDAGGERGHHALRGTACQLVAAEKISAAVRISSLPEQPHLNLPVPHRSLCMALQVKSGADCFTIHSVCCDEVRGSGEAASMSKAR